MADIPAQVSSSINALTEEFNTITHNLANVSTAGYKRRCTMFAKSLITAQQTGEIEESYGDIDFNSVFDFSQGNTVETGRPLDFALHGKGFFVIETPDGPLYTRNGMMQINQNGQIVDSQGRTVAGQAGSITIPDEMGPSQLNVSSDGNISAAGTTIGKFKLVDFKENENKLIAAGGNCFQMPDKEIEPVEAEQIVVKQGYQEVSNVKMIDELVSMITVSRLYEANMKFISARKQMSGSLMSVAMG